MRQRTVVLTHEFVEFMPKRLKDGTIYVSMALSLVMHKCCCGCGNEVVTPLSPTDWKLIFDGETITLDPSIGNWNFDCKSHYWITRNKAIWAPRWSQKQIDAGRDRDRREKEKYFGRTEATIGAAGKRNGGKFEGGKPRRGFWRKLRQWWSAHKE